MKIKSIFLILFFFHLCSCTQDRKDAEDHKRVTDELLWGIERIEPEIQKREPDTEDLSAKIKSLLVTNMSVEGQWDSHYWHDGVFLTVKKGREGRLEVHYYASGDLASWRLERTAAFKKGVLELDRPVMEYVPYKPYRHFYLITTPKGIRLVSQPLIRDWVLDKNPTNWNTVVVDENMLVKTETDASKKKMHH